MKNKIMPIALGVFILTGVLLLVLCGSEPTGELLERVLSWPFYHGGFWQWD